MIWIVLLSFISLPRSLSFSVPLTDNSKSKSSLSHLSRTSLFSYYPVASASASAFTAAHILFSSFRSTYANFWLDII